MKHVYTDPGCLHGQWVDSISLIYIIFLYVWCYATAISLYWYLAWSPHCLGHKFGTSVVCILLILFLNVEYVKLLTYAYLRSFTVKIQQPLLGGEEKEQNRIRWHVELTESREIRICNRNINENVMTWSKLFKGGATEFSRAVRIL